MYVFSKTEPLTALDIEMLVKFLICFYCCSRFNSLITAIRQLSLHQRQSRIELTTSLGMMKAYWICSKYAMQGNDSFSAQSFG